MSSRDDSINKNSIIGWVESSILLGGVLVAAIATSSVSLYRIDSMEEKLDKLITDVGQIGILKNDISNLKSNDLQTQVIFAKFSDSVDRLSITLAKLEGKVEGMKEPNHGEERGN